MDTQCSHCFVSLTALKKDGKFYIPEHNHPRFKDHCPGSDREAHYDSAKPVSSKNWPGGPWLEYPPEGR